MKYEYINELIRKGIISFSEAAEDEFNEEQSQEDEVKEEKDNENDDDIFGQMKKSVDDTAGMVDDLGIDGNDDATEDLENALENDEDYNEDIYGDEYYEDELRQQEEAELDEFMMSELGDDKDVEEYAQEIVEEKPIRKIQTVDVISKVVEKYTELSSKVDLLTWQELVSITPLSNKNKKKITKWDYIEDMKTLINKTFQNDNVEYVNIFNNLYDILTGGKWDKGLSVYSTINYGTPYITEGIFLLMYELAIDWAAFIGKFYIENPEIIAEQWEDDSFVRKFPNLTLLTYIAKLISESKEFDKFMTEKEAFEMTLDKEEFNLTMKQIQTKKEMIKTSGESLSYFANLVKSDRADILAGVLNKLGTVIFLHEKCKINLDERLQLIKNLIVSVTTRVAIETEESKKESNKYMSGLATQIDSLILARAEARLLLESDRSNFIYIKNDNE